MLMTPPDGEMPSLTNASQATAILAAAADSGTSETQRWELALLMGADPEDHGWQATGVKERQLPIVRPGRMPSPASPAADRRH